MIVRSPITYTSLFFSGGVQLFGDLGGQGGEKLLFFTFNFLNNNNNKNKYLIFNIIIFWGT